MDIVTEKDVKITLLEYPTDADWNEVKRIALDTMNKKMVNESDLAWRRRILRACHSPIRDLKFKFKLENVPYWLQCEFVRHHEGVQPYVGTQRNDRQDHYDRRYAPQAAPVQMDWVLNGEAMITVARKRLCGKATKEAQYVVLKMCEAVEQKCPEYAGFLVPNCCWQGGVCHESPCCGYNQYCMSAGMVIGSSKWLSDQS